MKTYDEMTEAVLRRRDAHRRRQTIHRRVAAVCAMACLLTAVAVTVRPFSPAVVPPTDGSSAPPDGATPITKRMESRLYLSAGEQDTLLAEGLSLPTAYALAVKDIRGLTEAEIEATYQLEHEAAQEIAEQTDQVVAHASTLRRENAIISLVRLGEFELEIDDPSKVVAISGKSSGEYGRVEFFYASTAIPKEDYGAYSGKEMTLTGDYYQILVQEEQNGTGRLEINWRPSSALYNAIDQNPALPLSTFSDIFLLCVEYADGTYEEHLVEIAFDDAGEADILYRQKHRIR